MRLNFIRFAVMALLIFCLAVAAMAQTYTPPTVDYTSQAQTVFTGLGSMVNGVLPTAIGIFVVFLGVKLFPKMIKRFLG